MILCKLANFRTQNMILDLHSKLDICKLAKFRTQTEKSTKQGLGKKSRKSDEY